MEDTQLNECYADMDNSKNIELIVRCLKEHQLRTIVISPGGTNIEFVKAVQDDPFFTCYSVVDERSAIYFSIGIYLQTKRPVVTSCTSAQATRNYIPGLTEAFYKKVPILAITMCKHPRFTFQEYMQAPKQDSLPIDSVKRSYMLPCVSDDNDILYSNRIINEAILELSLNGNGPVQLCVPWLDFSLKSTKIMNRIINRLGENDITKLKTENKRILICIGEHLPFSQIERKEIEHFCENHNVVVYTNHLSNYFGKYTIRGNLPLLTMDIKYFVDHLKPDILITIGGQPGDYPFYNILSRNDIDDIEHWRISVDGKVVDTYDKLSLIIQTEESSFFSIINKCTIVRKIEHDFYSEWKYVYDSVKYDIDIPFSAISIAQTLSTKIPKDTIMQFSILNSLRAWNMFQLDSSISCFSNVGAFGIDGGLSTLIGQSVVTEKLAIMIIGDLAFLYDINSISNKHIKSNLRILLVNNSGGVEFKLGGRDQKMLDKFIAASGHFKNAEGWASTCGFKYLSANDKESFNNRIRDFLGFSTKPILLETFISDENEAKAYKQMIYNNRERSLTNIAKSTIRRIIG